MALWCLLKSTDAALTGFAILLIGAGVAAVVEKVALQLHWDAALVAAGKLCLPTRPRSPSHCLCLCTHKLKKKTTHTHTHTQKYKDYYLCLNYLFQEKTMTAYLGRVLSYLYITYTNKNAVLIEAVLYSVNNLLEITVRFWFHNIGREWAHPSQAEEGKRRERRKPRRGREQCL